MDPCSITDMGNNHKICTKCRTEKDISEFFPRYGQPGKTSSWCKKCHIKNSEDYKRRNGAARIRYLETTWRRRLFTKFGLTAEMYDQMLRDQGGVCAICKKHESAPRSKLAVERGNRRFAVDHDHKTGGVRALLCNDCNRALGLFKESVELLRKAVEYLEKHR